MTAISQISASLEASHLKTLLIKAYCTDNKEVRLFAKQEILPMYAMLCREAREEVSQAISEMYGEGIEYAKK